MAPSLIMCWYVYVGVSRPITVTMYDDHILALLLRVVQHLQTETETLAQWWLRADWQRTSVWCSSSYYVPLPPPPRSTLHITTRLPPLAVKINLPGAPVKAAPTTFIIHSCITNYQCVPLCPPVSPCVPLCPPNTQGSFTPASKQYSPLCN